MLIIASKKKKLQKNNKPQKPKKYDLHIADAVSILHELSSRSQDIHM